ncbi:hypothetical protein DFR58_10873 [Anaerobacterium chartisolvens]|uniref:Uncharacterized protein n=1 Tax=Anaerobacterium chartisolvens TaxID=1297424 RepID=A0A369B6N8_9FIRM|nr:hypothetical protein [Anaerobacterium chartisolvens]RCX17179.1 hypothetical protein DFR58_10873 [Anaerobacterium chartisolvens]
MDCKGAKPGKRIEAAEEILEDTKLKCNANNKGCAASKQNGKENCNKK